MTGVSFIWLLVTTFCLFSLVACAPSGAKNALISAISMELYWSGAFLSLTSALLSILIWIWKIPLEAIVGPNFKTFFDVILPTFVSTIFGAFSWITISIALTNKSKRFPMIVLSLGYCALMTGLNYTANLQVTAYKLSPLIGGRDEAIDIIASIFILMTISFLAYKYIKYRNHLQIAHQR